MKYQEEITKNLSIGMSQIEINVSKHCESSQQQSNELKKVIFCKSMPILGAVRQTKELDLRVQAIEP